MLFLECVAWIPVVLCNLMRAYGIGVRDEPLELILQDLTDDWVLVLQENDVVNDLPDDCLVDVLTRLSSNDIFTCRRVCKKWRILTSSNLFIESHTKRAPNIIIGDVMCDDSLGHKYFTVVDGKGIIKLKELQLNKIGTKFTLNSVQLLHSFGGLLLFRDSFGIFIVLNTISRKEAIIRRPQDNDGNDLHGIMCGLFFHPLGCEYKLLYVHNERYNESFWYYVYGSASKSWRRINTTPLHVRPKNSFAPVVMDMGLHWIAHFGDTVRPVVVVFKIDSEEICTFPLHELVGNDNYDSSMITIFEMDKQLCFGHQNTDTETINLWVLYDYQNWRWRKMTSLCFSYPIRTGPHRNGLCCNTISRNKLRIFYVCQGVLLISWEASQPYLLDIARNRFYIMPTPHIRFSIENDLIYNYFTYTCSLKIPNV